MHCRFLGLAFCGIVCFHGLAGAQTQETFTNATGDGLWSDANNWNPTTAAGGPNGNYTVTILCCLGSPVGGAILDKSVSIVNLTIDANGGLYITNNSVLTITGKNITNNGTLAIQDVSGYTGGGSISIENHVTLAGLGSTVLNSSYTDTITGGGRLINMQALKGQSGGTISVSLQNRSPGLITGGPLTDPLLLTNLTTNTGTISGLGYTSVAISSTVENAGGIIDGGLSGQVLLRGCTIIGGTIGSASVDSGHGGSSPTLSAVTITGTYTVASTPTHSAETTLKGAITNNGNIIVSSNSERSAELAVSGAVKLIGTGKVSMSGPHSYIESLTGSATLTNASPHQISGGAIGVIGSSMTMTVTNESEISNASIYTPVLNTGGTITDPVTIDGGCVQRKAACTANVVQNGTIVAPVNPGVSLTDGVTLSGVTITGSQGVVNAVNATFDGTTAANTIETTVEVLDNDTLTVKGTLDVVTGGELYQDCFAAISSIAVSGATTITGTGGTIATSTCKNNDIVGVAGTSPSLTIGVTTVSSEGGIWGDGTFGVTIDAATTVTDSGYGLTVNTGSKKFQLLGTLVETDSTFDILGTFGNYNSTTNTLSGGTYTLGGNLQFNNANLVNNGAKLTLDGNGLIENQNGVSGLTSFNNNEATGTFELANEQSFTTGGTFNNEGKFTILANSFFTVGGTTTNYNQSGASAVTTVDGRINVPTGGLIDITGGKLQGAGQYYGDVSIGNAAGGAAATLIVGDSTKVSAQVTVENNYTQLATGVLDVQIGGVNVGSEYSQLNVTGPVTLGGTLTATVINKFKAVEGDQFTILNAPSGVTGTFTTLKLPANYSVVYNPTSVVLEYQ
jgi:fibronectin-binding autotransporter adhesin